MQITTAHTLVSDAGCCNVSRDGETVRISVHAKDGGDAKDIAITMEEFRSIVTLLNPFAPKDNEAYDLGNGQVGVPQRPWTWAPPVKGFTDNPSSCTYNHVPCKHNGVS